MLADLLNRAGMLCGDGGVKLGGGIEAAGRYIKNKSLYLKCRNQAELLMRHGKYTAEALDAKYRHCDNVAANILAEQLVVRATEGIEIHWLAPEEIDAIEAQLAEELCGA